METLIAQNGGRGRGARRTTTRTRRARAKREEAPPPNGALALSSRTWRLYWRLKCSVARRLRAEQLPEESDLAGGRLEIVLGREEPHLPGATARFSEA